VRVDGEVLLSGGAINSPQLLLLSASARAAPARGRRRRRARPARRRAGPAGPPGHAVHLQRRGSSLKDAEDLKHVADYYLRRRGR
jgi:hypothetical protein